MFEVTTQSQFCSFSPFVCAAWAAQRHKDETPALWARHDHFCSTHQPGFPGSACTGISLANQNGFWHTSDSLSSSRNWPAYFRNNQKAPTTHLFDYLTCPSKQSLPCRIMTFHKEETAALKGRECFRESFQQAKQCCSANELTSLLKILLCVSVKWHPDTPNKGLCVPGGGSRPRLRSHRPSASSLLPNPRAFIKNRAQVMQFAKPCPFPAPGSHTVPYSRLEGWGKTCFSPTGFHRKFSQNTQIAVENSQKIRGSVCFCFFISWWR